MNQTKTAGKSARVAVDAERIVVSTRGLDQSELKMLAMVLENRANRFVRMLIGSGAE